MANMIIVNGMEVPEDFEAALAKYGAIRYEIGMSRHSMLAMATMRLEEQAAWKEIYRQLALLIVEGVNDAEEEGQSMREQKCKTCNRMIDYEWAVNNDGYCGVCGPVRQQNMADRETSQEGQQRQGREGMPLGATSEAEATLASTEPLQTSTDESLGLGSSSGNGGFLDRLIIAIERTNATSKIAEGKRGGNAIVLSADDWFRIYQTALNLKQLVEFTS